MILEWQAASGWGSKTCMQGGRGPPEGQPPVNLHPGFGVCFSPSKINQRHCWPLGFLGVALRSISTCLSQLEFDNKNLDGETLPEPLTSFQCDKGKKIKGKRSAGCGFSWSWRTRNPARLAFAVYVDSLKQVNSLLFDRQVFRCLLLLWNGGKKYRMGRRT